MGRLWAIASLSLPALYFIFRKPDIAQGLEGYVGTTCRDHIASVLPRGSHTAGRRHDGVLAHARATDAHPAGATAHAPHCARTAQDPKVGDASDAGGAKGVRAACDGRAVLAGDGAGRGRGGGAGADAHVPVGEREGQGAGRRRGGGGGGRGAWWGGVPLHGWPLDGTGCLATKGARAGVATTYIYEHGGQR